MHERKLVQVLKAIDKKRHTELRKYIYRVTEKNSEEQALFEYLWKSRNNWTAPRLAAKRVLKAVKSDATEAQMDKLMSRLLKKVEKFLVNTTAETTQQEIEDTFKLAHFYRQNGLENYFKESLKHIQQLLLQLPQSDAQYYLFENQLWHLHHFSNIDRALPPLEKANWALEKFYQHQKKLYQTESINQEVLFNQAPNLNVDTVQIAYKEIFARQQRMIQENSEADFLFLKAYLLEHISRLSLESAYILYNYLTNFCANKISEGGTEYYLHIAQLQSFGVQSTIALYNGKMTEIEFLNYINVQTNLETTDRNIINANIKNCAQFTNTHNAKGLQVTAQAVFDFAVENYSKAQDAYNSTYVSASDKFLFSKAVLIHVLSTCTCDPNNKYSNPLDVINRCRRVFEKESIELPNTYQTRTLNLMEVVAVIWPPQPFGVVVKTLQKYPKINNRKWLHQEIKRRYHRSLETTVSP
ncbi:MAG: hypothetical protein AAF960_08730 [Bacteroidota bacterium]